MRCAAWRRLAGVKQCETIENLVAAAVYPRCCDLESGVAHLTQKENGWHQRKRRKRISRLAANIEDGA
jgi:hypothetical protein